MQCQPRLVREKISKYRARANDYYRFMRISLFLFFLAGIIIFWMQSAQANTSPTPLKYEKMAVLTEDSDIPEYIAFSSLSNPTKKSILITENARKREIDDQKQNNNSFTINASAYTASADECGNSKGITASGEQVRAKHTLACPPQYAFGTKINIDGYGTFTCKDRGGAIKDNHFDIYMETKSEAFAFGRRTLTANVVS